MNLRLIAVSYILTFGLLSCTDKVGEVIVADYEELPQLIEPNPEDWASVQGTKFSWGSTWERYDAYKVPVEEDVDQITIKGWKGEVVYAQAVVYTQTGIDALNYELCDFKSNSKAKLHAENAEIGFVRYTLADGENDGGDSNCGDRRDHSYFDSSMVADVIDPYIKTLKIAPMQTRPIWVSFKIPQGTESGLYTGKLRIKNGKKSIGELVLNISVGENVLPEPSEWRFHLDLWQNPFAVARIENLPLWSDEHFEAMRPLMERLARAGQRVITTSIIHQPWSAQTEDPYDSMIDWVKESDGTWSFGYDVFDKWVSFMMSCGIDRQISCFSMIPWRTDIRYYDVASADYSFVNVIPGTKEYADLWTTMLTSFVEHLKEKGWLDLCAISMDERPKDVMDAAIKVIRSVDKNLKISLAGSFLEGLEKDIHDLCVLVNDDFPQEAKERRQVEGKVSTIYTCCVPKKPNSFLCSSLAEGTWLGYLIAAQDFDGFLRWAYNSWPVNPLQDSRFWSHAAGDVFMVYPGNRSSLRFEKMVEGNQAYEKIQILKRKYMEEDNIEAYKELMDALGKIDISEVYCDRALENLLPVKELLN